MFDTNCISSLNLTTLLSAFISILLFFQDSHLLFIVTGHYVVDFHGAEQRHGTGQDVGAQAGVSQPLTFLVRKNDSRHSRVLLIEDAAEVSHVISHLGAHVVVLSALLQLEGHRLVAVRLQCHFEELSGITVLFSTISGFDFRIL